MIVPIEPLKVVFVASMGLRGHCVEWRVVRTNPRERGGVSSMVLFMVTVARKGV
jgi:hypothetical protein